MFSLLGGDAFIVGVDASALALGLMVAVPRAGFVGRLRDFSHGRGSPCRSGGSRATTTGSWLREARLGVTGTALGSEAGGLFLAKQGRERPNFLFEGARAALGLLDPALQLGLAQRQDVTLDHEVLAITIERCSDGAALELCAVPGLLERLKPEALGGVGDGFGEAVQGVGAGIEAAGEAPPPLVEQRVDGVRGAAADLRADLLDGGALAVAKQGVGGTVDVGRVHGAGGDAAGEGGRRYSATTVLHVANTICT